MTSTYNAATTTIHSAIASSNSHFGMCWLASFVKHTEPLSSCLAYFHRCAWSDKIFIQVLKFSRYSSQVLLAYVIHPHHFLLTILSFYFHSILTCLDYEQWNNTTYNRPSPMADGQPEWQHGTVRCDAPEQNSNTNSNSQIQITCAASKKASQN